MIYENFFTVVKIKSKKSVRKRKGHKIKIRRKKIYKPKDLKNNDLKRFIVDGVNCECPQLSKNNSRENKMQDYLVMGKKKGKTLKVKALYKWDKQNEVLKRAKKSFNLEMC